MITSQQKGHSTACDSNIVAAKAWNFISCANFVRAIRLRQIRLESLSRKNKTDFKGIPGQKKDQQIIFMLDCSRRMRSIDGELRLLRSRTACHADNVGQVALRRGRYLGILSFGAGYRWQNPLKSSGADQ